MRQQSCGGLTGAGGSFSRVAYSCGWQVSPGHWQENSVAYHVDPSTELLVCPHSVFSESPRAKIKFKVNVPVSSVTQLQKSHTTISMTSQQLHRSSLLNWGGVCYSRDVNIERQASVEAIMESVLASTEMKGGN